ncbi:uncharacterized protein LOC110990761, partial [Acanthaster planci]|uniref:Uncharacterized protein LOC110990761 n=1 Tax=Acanthaster planci TaxID=133434 RepID=A0A8B8A1K0_ACAPL
LSLDLRGSEVITTQNSVDGDDPFYARFAVDRDLSTFSHTGWRTLEQRTNPWWKVDLGGVHCLRKITLINAIHHAHRLEGNVVRAGLNSNHLLNPEIGRVAASQTLSRAVIDFTPEPYVIAQYVSVDIHGSDPQTIVQLTEVMVEEVNTATTKQAIRKGMDRDSRRMCCKQRLIIFCN